MARRPAHFGPVREPCVGIDAQAAEKIATEYGLGDDVARRLRGVGEDVPYWLTRAMDMAFAMRRHPVGREVVLRLLEQADRAKQLKKHFGARWEKLVAAAGPDAFAEFHRALLASEEQAWPDDQALRDRGLSRPARQLFNEYRRLMGKSLWLMNMVRKAQGLEPIAGIKGVYFPHEFNGNYHATVDGKMLVTPSGSSWDTQADAFEAVHRHLVAHPADVGKVAIHADFNRKLQHVILGDPSEFGDLNRTLAAVSRGSSLSEAEVADAFRQGLRKTGWKTHMLPREGRAGYDTANVKTVIQDYLNTLPWWASAEIAKADIRDTLAGKLDPEVEPHAVRALQRYVAQVYGHPGSWEITTDQIMNRAMHGPVGRLLSRYLTPLEATPLIGRVAKAVNPSRFNPARPSARLSTQARSLAGDLKMGNFSYGVFVTHMLHLPTNVWPTVGTKYLALGLRDVFVNTPEMTRAYRWGLAHDVFKAQLLDDAPNGPLSNLLLKATKNLPDLHRQLIFMAWRPIGLSEMWIRQAAFFATYRALKDKGVAGERLLRLATDDTLKELPDLQKHTERMVLELSKRATELIANRYDRASRPWWTTGAYGGLVGQFKSYITNTIGLQKRLWDLGGSNKIRAMAPLSVMLTLGGAAGGVPFAHLVDDAIRFLTSNFDPEGRGGISPLDNFYVFLNENLPPPAAEAFYRGLPALGGVDLTRRVGFSHLHLESPKDLAGAFASTIYDTMLYLYFHDLEHAQQISPGIGNIIQAQQWADENMARDPWHRDRMRFPVSGWDIVKRFLGMEPLEQARTTDVLRITGREQVARTRQRALYIDQMIDALKHDDDPTFERLQAAAAAANMPVSPEDVLKEIAEKQKPALERRLESLPKSMREEYTRRWGPILAEQQEKEQAAAAARALSDVQRGKGE